MPSGGDADLSKRRGIPFEKDGPNLVAGFRVNDDNLSRVDHKEAVPVGMAEGHLHHVHESHILFTPAGREGRRKPSSLVHEEDPHSFSPSKSSLIPSPLLLAAWFKCWD